MSHRNLRQVSLGLRHTMTSSGPRIQRAQPALNKYFSPIKAQRNPSWPEMPTVLSTDNKVVGLFAVFPLNTGGLNNYCAMSASATSGYSVDWGDGTNTNHGSGTGAYHEYDYNSASLANTNAPVTFSGNNTVNRTNHGYVDGQIVRFYNVVNGGSITEAADYFVVNAQTDTFQITQTRFGTALTFNGTGSATLLPYKIAVVTITAQSSGNILAWSCNLRHTSAGTSTYTDGWLELAISMPLASGSASTILGIGGLTNNVYHSFLEIVNLVNVVGMTSYSYLFQNCFGLRRAYCGYDSSAMTFCNYTFNQCYNLEEAPNWNTSNSTQMNSCFQSCKALVKAPDWNLSSMTSVSNAFSGCTALQYLPAYKFPACTVFDYFLQNCSALMEVPRIDMPAANSAQAMYYGCSSLKYIPDFTTSSALNTLYQMFYNCYALITAPRLSVTSGVTNAQQLYTNCYALKNVPWHDFSNVTTGFSMFQNCNAIETLPKYNLAKITNMQTFCQNCYCLKEFPDMNTLLNISWASAFAGCYTLRKVYPNSQASVTSSAAYSSMFSTCYGLESMLMPLKYTFTISSCHMSPKGLDDMYTALPTVSAQTVTVTSNYGTATDTPSIATAKGWTVSGT